MPSARPSIQPDVMPISKKKKSTLATSAVTSMLARTLVRNMVWILHMLRYFGGVRTYFKGAKTNYDILGVREHNK